MCTGSTGDGWRSKEQYRTKLEKSARQSGFGQALVRNEISLVKARKTSFPFGNRVGSSWRGEAIALPGLRGPLALDKMSGGSTVDALVSDIVPVAVRISGV